MTLSLKPGSWLEITEYHHEKAVRIFSSQHIECLVIKETDAHLAPLFPFIILIHSLEQIQTSTWKTSEHFQGFLWRTQFVNENLQACLTNNIWLDLIMNDFKTAQRALQTVETWPFKAYFFSPSEQFSLRKLNEKFKKQIPIFPRPFDLSDTDYSRWDELETFESSDIEVNPIENPKLSIIIPHFESPYFICNVLKHLQEAFNFSPLFEVLVVDDSSSQSCFDQISYFVHRKIQSLPVRLLRWKERHYLSNGQKIFRAGASRNWGASLAKSDHLFFLDSDMLTPPQIAVEVLSSLDKYDVVQFVRHHIPIHLSSETTAYNECFNSSALFIEEATYWNKLFQSEDWTALSDYWKYTCTYALALKKETFLNVGRIRRNFIRYGFEDTDLGYRLFKAQYRFKLNTTPLLHLTGRQDQSQGIAYRIEKLHRIKPMAKVFYKLNLDPNIYEKFQSFLD